MSRVFMVKFGVLRLFLIIQKHLKIKLFPFTLAMSINFTKNLTVNLALSACSQASRGIAKRFS